jgi:arginase
MPSPRSAVLVVPQWQGFAADDRPRLGALAIAEALGGVQHTIAVPAWRALAGEAAGEGTVHGLADIAGQTAAVRGWLEDARPDRLLVLGGDCGSDLAPIGWQANRFGPDLGVLYLDAHADSNTPASSPSGRFHGMVLRAALGDGASALAARGPAAIAAAQLVMAGVRDLDPAERAFLEAAGIRPLPADAIGDGRVLGSVLAHRARHWHVHLDLDVLDPDDFPEVTVPTPHGTTLAAVTQLLLALAAQRALVSLTITEHVGGEPSARRVAALITVLRDAGWR